jgi:hypothetical protein
MIIKTIKEKMGHDLYPQRDTPFIGIEIGTVERSHVILLRIFDSEKKIKARYFLTEIRKIFSDHLRSDLTYVFSS